MTMSPRAAVVLHRWVQRSLASVRLRDVHPPRRSWSVRSSVHTRMQGSEVGLELRAVVLPCDVVDARCCIPLQREEGRPESVKVDVVQERGEPRSLVSNSGLTYTVERLERLSPALSPARLRLVRVPRGQAPSLHRRRGQIAGVVRRLRWYYGPVRLPRTVHRRVVALGRSDAARRANRGGRCRALPVLAQRVSVRATGLRPRGPAERSPWRARSVWPSASLNGVGAPECLISRLNTVPARAPVNASPSPLRAPAHDSGSSWVAGPSM